MIRTSFVVCLALAASTVAALAQQPLPALQPGVSDTSPFRPLELPTPNAYRTGSGRPGPLYWQQRADYTIRASLDTATLSVRGE